MDMILDIGRSFIPRQFYRMVTKRSVFRACGHVIVIAVLWTVAFTVFANMNGLSQINDFLSWAKTNFPTMTFTGRSLTTVNVQEPYWITYPKGNITFVFSTKQDFPDMTTLPANSILVANSKITFVRADGMSDAYDLANVKELPENAQATIDETVIEKFAQIINRYFTPLVFFFVLVFSILAYFMSALFYSLIGLLVTALAKIKLSFGGLFSISVYALTIINVFIILSLFIPFLNFPFQGLFFIIVTITYVTLGILMNKEVINEKKM